MDTSDFRNPSEWTYRFKLKLITKNQNVIKSVNEFIKYKNEEKFDCLVDCFQNDL